VLEVELISEFTVITEEFALLVEFGSESGGTRAVVSGAPIGDVSSKEEKFVSDVSSKEEEFASDVSSKEEEFASVCWPKSTPGGGAEVKL
jgi:hypothetical protein